MDIQSVETFLQVANLENFTLAAKEMNYAQSTVTMQIQRLEQELGVPLFERIGRKNYLTAAGQEFLPRALEILRIMEEARTLHLNDSELHGTLRVGVLESLMFASVLDVLPGFSSRYPNVDVLLKIGQAADLAELLRKNQLDIIYVSNSPVNDPSLRCCYMRREEMVFVVSPEHPLAKRKRIDPKEILSYPFIVAEPTGRCYGRLQEIAAEQGVEVRHSVMVDNIAAISMLLRGGQNITFLPQYSLETQLERGELVRLDTDLEPQAYYSQILYHKNKWISPFMESFIDMIREIRPGDRAEA